MSDGERLAAYVEVWWQPIDELINEVRASATVRKTALLADPPTDASARPPRIFGGLGWDWQALLRNRPLDVWMHEQDVRRAVGRPAGTTLLVDAAGQEPVACVVDARGRGELLPEPPPEPTVSLTTDRETFIQLAGGRTTPPPGLGEVGQRLLDLIAITP